MSKIYLLLTSLFVSLAGTCIKVADYFSELNAKIHPPTDLDKRLYKESLRALYRTKLESVDML